MQPVYARLRCLYLVFLIHDVSRLDISSFPPIPFNVDRSVSSILVTMLHVILFLNFHYSCFGRSPTVTQLSYYSYQLCKRIHIRCAFHGRLSVFSVFPMPEVTYSLHIQLCRFNVFQFKHKYQCLRLIPYFHLRNFNIFPSL